MTTFERLASGLRDKHGYASSHYRRETLVGYQENRPAQLRADGEWDYPDVIELWVIEDCSKYGIGPLPLEEVNQWMKSTWGSN